MDRISQLPDFIIHHILSFVSKFHGPPVALVRMSVLSKTWFDLTASFPILFFNIRKFTSPETFFKYVEYTTSRFCHQNVTAHEFSLYTIVKEPTELDIVDRCLGLVLKNGVRDLVINISYLSDEQQKYRLPNRLLSVSMLKSLIIRGCDLPSSLFFDVPKFKSLTWLTLEDIQIDEEVIKYFTISCPLLKGFDISRCHGFKCFCVYGHQNLHSVFIFYCTQLERIDIEAPNLGHLWVNMEERGPPRMNLASCKKLRVVTYTGHPSSNNFLSNFPFIETLFFQMEDTSDNLKWSSHSLRTLVLESDCDLEEVELNTPNLVLFIYGSHSRMVTRWSLSRDSTNLKACMECYPNGSLGALWFQKLRLFLDKKNGFKVLNLYIFALHVEKLVELEKLKAIELPPYELEHVGLQLNTSNESSGHVAFVDAILWCCRPRSLTLISSSSLTDFVEQNDDVVKFICEKLLQQEDEGHISIQIVSCHEGKTISFIKKEVVQEEAGMELSKVPSECQESAADVSGGWQQ
ncbi:hypothetical protein SSX86_010046 [Deinandra increscens subsp. villosa]|uniref:F-box domain-containing protein n=1 Tax=Deinandra increscens subsp. villosa TaxID=3103831 RepID=A0AAP0DF64_9ASTR